MLHIAVYLDFCTW